MRSASRRSEAWAGTLYRSAPPKWASGRDMLAGKGSFQSGGRFNAAGSFAAIYGSTTPELAMMESLAYQRRAGLPVERALPLVFKALRVEIQRLLNLTDAVVLGELGLTIGQLRDDQWWLARARGSESLTQALGRAVHACGVQGMLVPSAQAADLGCNIVLLPDHIAPPARPKVLRRPTRP